MTPRPNADIIHAWADGAEIQRYDCMHWVDDPTPTFEAAFTWRIKPEHRRYKIAACVGVSGETFTTTADNADEETYAVSRDNFLGWITPDWVEHEVPTTEEKP